MRLREYTSISSILLGLILLLSPGLALAAPTPSAPVTTQSQPAPVLTKADVSAWLDGFMPYAIQRANVAGVSVSIVKDGQVLVEKGYGFSDVKAQKRVDPKTTLFRPGSISKLFTWTAVMQLVEAGKINLDTDINNYLDFRIPPAFGKPITMRDLMTHTPGFEETIKNLIATNPKAILSLHDALADWIPERMFPPGKVSAYSNYGAGLAGYIVQRVSGQPYAQYIETHIFKPLGMTHSTFVQPLPKPMRPDMSKGYMTADGKAKPFEIVDMIPAGALSSTADDMARFMLAYLNGGTYNGAKILSRKSISEMWSNQHQLAPGLPPMGLGFYHMDMNGRTVVGHGGDTLLFHSDLFLIPGAHVGVFFSQNSMGGKHGQLRGALFKHFMKRYFPARMTAHRSTLKSAKADAARIAGRYLVSRRSDSNFLRIVALLNQPKITADADGTVTFNALTNSAGVPYKWREVAPLRWQQVGGNAMLVATQKDGRITGIASSLIPAVMTFTPVPFWRSAAWSMPLLIATLAMLMLTVVFWPLKAILRWRYDRPFHLRGREAWLYRGTRLVALVNLAFLLGWSIFLTLAGTHLGMFSAASDPLLHGLQFLGLIGAIGVIVPYWDLIVSLPDRSRPWWTKASTLLVALACTATVWFAVSERLIGWSLNY